MIVANRGKAPLEHELVIARAQRVARGGVHGLDRAAPGPAVGNCLRSTEGGPDLRQSGVSREIVSPERLVFMFTWEEEGERGLETLVTVTLAETRMMFRQAPFQSDKERDGFQGGQNSAFDLRSLRREVEIADCRALLSLGYSPFAGYAGRAAGRFPVGA